MRILLVEDEPSGARFIAKGLREARHAVDVAAIATYPGELHYFTRDHVLRDTWTRVDAFFGKWLKPERVPPGSR